jgi:fructose-1,6-bisphosphatase/inositol monophosphatase family enzyme
MRDIDPRDIVSLMRDAAERIILPKYKNLEEGDIDTKSSPTDLVTVADIQSEAFLTHELKRLYPEYEILGEEKASRDPSAFELLKNTQQPYVVIDPIDGTGNFVAGKAEFGMILSVVKNGEVVQAYIYDALEDHFVTAIKGLGAYDGTTRIYLGATHHLKSGIGKDKYFDDSLKASFNKAATGEGFDVSVLGCSAHEYMHLVRGKERFYFACNAKPWDHLAGSLIIREAGGVCKNWDGTDYKPKDLNTSILSASTDQDWAYIRNKLLGNRTSCKLKPKR